MTDALQAAEKFLLNTRTVTLTSPVLPAEDCRAVAAANALKGQCGREEAARLCAGMLTAMGIKTTTMSDKERVAATDFCGRISAMPGAVARHLTAIAVSSGQFGVPAKADMAKLEKMAEARRASLEALAVAMGREIERRAAGRARDEQIEADRARKTPEEWKAFVEQKLKAAGFR